MILYHGSRASFKHFDPAFFKTGEGVGNFNGWYFCSAEHGALVHCESYLRCSLIKSEGFILTCSIDPLHVENDVDGVYADPIYRSSIYGVSLSSSKEIKILDVSPARDIFERTHGKIEH